MPDGSFSQYSMTYHRLMLDSYGLAEVWRLRLRIDRFSRALRERLQAATLWLAHMTDPTTGDVPVIGADDGAHLIRLTDTDTRDFRPSVQLAAALFVIKRVIPLGRMTANWLDLICPDRRQNLPIYTTGPLPTVVFKCCVRAPL